MADWFQDRLAVLIGGGFYDYFRRCCLPAAAQDSRRNPPEIRRQFVPVSLPSTAFSC
jgi:hypothetical protein